jgi:sucrose-6-phosphate hydrolase SacC (GH32 family)
MTIPRELSLVMTNDGIRLAQFPVSVASLHSEKIYQTAARSINGREILPVRGRRLELIAEFEAGTSSRFGLELHHGAQDAIRIVYAAEQLSIHRPPANIENYPTQFSAPLTANSGRIRLHILLDESSIEVFAGNNTVVLTAQTFGSPENNSVVVFSEGGVAQLHQLDIFVLNSIWENVNQTTPDFCQDT